MANNNTDMRTGARELPSVGQPVVTDDEVIFSEEILASYAGSASAWRKQAQSDYDFRNNNQFTPAQEKILNAKNHAAIPINILHPAVEQAKAQLTANRPRFVAVGREGSDIRVASVFSDLMSYIWYNSNGNQELKNAIEDYYTRGMGVLCAYVDPQADYGKGEVMLKAIDPFHFFVDPNSQDQYCRDAAHMLLSREMTKEQVERTYPDLIGKLNIADGQQRIAKPASQRIGDDGGRLVQDRFHTKFNVIDRYTKIKVEKTHLIDPVGEYEKVLSDEEAQEEMKREVYIEMDKQKNMRFIVAEKEVAQADQLFAQTGGEYFLAQDQNGQTMPVPANTPPEQLEQAGMQMIPNTEKSLIKQTMTDVVELEGVIVDKILVDRVRRIFSVGGLKVYDDVLPIEHYPIVPIMNRHNRNPYPMSDVRFVRPIQELINKMISLVIAHTTSATGNKLLIPRDSQNRKELLKEWMKAGPSVIEYDPELGVPIISGPTALANEVFVLIQDSVSKVYDILGIYPLGQGAPQNAPETFKGTVALDEFGQRRLKSKKDDIEDCINMLARVVVQLIQSTYTFRKVVRIIKPNNTTETVQINTLVDDTTPGMQYKINDVTTGKYDIVMVAGSTMPLNRWALTDYYMNLYEKGIIDNIEVLKQTEVIDAAGVLERVDKVKQLTGMLQQMEKKLSDLEGDLQTATRESVSDRKRVEIEKFKTELSQLANEAKSATTVYTKRIQDELEVGKRELKVAAKEKKAE